MKGAAIPPTYWVNIRIFMVQSYYNCKGLIHSLIVLHKTADE
jgi:hypothetical protein